MPKDTKERVIMNTSEQLEAVELSIEAATKAIKKRSILVELTADTKFEEIIINGYFKEEASRLVLLRATPTGRDNLAEIDDMINAIGNVRQYLHTIMQLGAQAEKAMAEAEITREELLAEDL